MASSALPFVDGTTDLNAQTFNQLEVAARKGQPNGYAALDATGKVPAAQVSPVAGPQGPAGPQGATGAVGPQGPAGSTAAVWMTGDTKISAQAATHADPAGGTWFLADGSAIPAGNAPLVALLGANLPDARGRGLVAVGPNGAVNAIGRSEGNALGNRRPQHRTSFNDPGHITPIRYGRGSGAYQAFLADTNYNFGDYVNDATPLQYTGIAVGSGVGADSVDTGAFIVAGNLFYHS